jgi:hypothetical protein
MTHLSPKARLEFVEHLELDQPKLRTHELPVTPEIKPNDTANYVNDGSLISFVTGLSSEDKSDVLNSVLLAQRAVFRLPPVKNLATAWC